MRKLLLFLATLGFLLPIPALAACSPVALGGTGNCALGATFLLIGNGTSPVATSSTLFFTTALNRLTMTNASTSVQTVSSNLYLTALGTPAGTVLAVDPDGKVIATTTAAGGSGTVTNVATTYPLTGGPITTTGTLALAFGTTTANTWSALNIFANATSTLFSATSAWIGTLMLTNPLTVANGGTGAATLTGCLTGNGTGAITGSGTCNTSNATVSSITGGLGLNGGAITTSGTLSLKSYTATSTADTSGQITFFTSTNATPATYGGDTDLTFTNGNLLTATNASTTNLSVNNNEVSGERYLSGRLSTSTAWTSTSSVSSVFADTTEIIPPFTGTITKFTASTSAGTLGILVSSGASTFYYPASSTAGIYPVNLTFTKGVPIFVQGGTPASSPTFVPFTMTATGF